MTEIGRNRLIALALVCVAHAGFLAAHAADGSFILDEIFRPDVVAVLDGALPYGERDFEYPPLALGVLGAPELAAGSDEGYRTAFGLEMAIFDVAILLLLAWAVRREAAVRFWAVIGVYAIGSILLFKLVIARFDIVPAALVLAAVIARGAGRSATWGGLLGLATAVKAFPLALAPPFVRGEPSLGRAAFAAAIPLAVAAGLLVGLGDEFTSAISYHSERALQIESVAATPFLVANQLGAAASVPFDAGSFNLDAQGVEVARAVTTGSLVAAYLLVVAALWRRPQPPAVAATVILAVLVVLAPVLSPQFLLWLLPVSALAFGAGKENWVLLAAALLTRVEQDNYDQVTTLGGAFVWPTVARNVLLLVYLGMVLVPVFRGLALPALGRPAGPSR